MLIVDDFLPHSTKVAAKMMFDLALSLKDRGDIVTVLTPDPFQNEIFEQKVIDGIDVVSFKSGKIKNVSKIRRAINETLLPYYAWKRCSFFLKNNMFDTIIYYSPTIFWGCLVRKLKKIYNANTYLILRDIFPQWAVDNGLIKVNSFIHKYFKYFENINYEEADKIGVMSKANLNFCRSHFKNPNKFEVLFNWTKINPKKNNENSFRREMSLDDKVIFFYGGNIGQAQNMNNLIELAINMRSRPKAHFLFVGKGDEVDILLCKKKQYQLTNVTYLPPVDQDTYFQILSEIDVGLFNLHPDHKTHNFPGKILGYMEYSKPILGCVNTGNDLKDIVNEYRAGFIFEYENKEEFYNSAIKLLESESLRTELGKNGFMLLHNQFNVDKIVCAF